MTTDAWTEYQPRESSDPEKVVGFQLMYDQLADYRPLQKWVTDSNVSIVHLIRQNALKLLLSRLVAKKTGQYQFAREGSKPKVFLDPTIITAQLDKIVSKREKMSKKFPDNPYLEITYERFFSKYFEESKRIFAFLGVARAEMEFPSFLRKLNPDSLKDRIENYDEIAMVLKGTPYQVLL